MADLNKDVNFPLNVISAKGSRVRSVRPGASGLVGISKKLGLLGKAYFL